MYPAPRLAPARASLLRATLALAGLAAATHAPGQQASWTTHPALQDRWSVQVGLYSPKVDTTFRLDGSGGQVGTEVSAEEDLGLKERNDMPAILASVRLGERWRLEAEYLSLERENSRALNRTINWGDNSYTLGTTVSSSFRTEIYRLSVGYSFVKDAQKEFGVALGLHATDVTASIAATSVGAETGEMLAPLPTIGIYGAYAPTPRWLISGRVDIFSLKYEEFDGSLVNVTLGVDYRLWRNLGLGLAWRYIDYDLDVTEPRFSGSFNYSFSGPLLYLVSSF
jgi:opacity protein-like surface antigen